MRRREAIAVLGGAAVLPFVTRAQPGTIRRIGLLGGGSPGPIAHLLTALRSGLGEMGINLRTAGTTGLTIPPSLLVRADEVIE